MPACELSDEGEPINLSLLVSEEAWQPLRDIANDKRDHRRVLPPFRWLGPLPCECVLQAVAAFSLKASPMAAAWPAFIEHPFLSMQRVICVDSPSSVRELWAAGAAEPPWAYVPVFAFLKMFPAHSPLLLPSGTVSEANYMKPPGRYATDLNLSAAAGEALTPRPVYRLAFAEMAGRLVHHHQLPKDRGRSLDATRPPIVLPRSHCHPHGCDGLGWCDGTAPASPPSCRCASQMSLTATEPSAGSCVVSEAGRVADIAEKRRRAERSRRMAGRSAVSEPSSAVDSKRSRLRRGTQSLGPDLWRRSAGRAAESAMAACPNTCSGHGLGCSYGFCHCERGHWGLDCGLSRSRVASLAARRADARPRVHVYPLPPALRRSCNFWHLAEDVGDRLLRSEFVEPNAAEADLYWIYGCPNGDTLLPALRWVQAHFPQWNASVGAQRPRHVVVIPHEEGWAEVWRYLVHWLRGASGDHANERGTWDSLHPASPTRQVVALQLSGRSDYPSAGHPKPIRCVSSNAPCYVCFQPGKDVMIPGHPGLIDYPGRDACAAFKRLGAYDGDGHPRWRTNSPTVLFGGAVWTVPQGPGFYEPSRLILYLCHKNASSRALSISITQTETQPESVRPWEVERHRDLHAAAREANFCIVPEGKIGGYGECSPSSQPRTPSDIQPALPVLPNGPPQLRAVCRSTRAAHRPPRDRRANARLRAHRLQGAFLIGPARRGNRLVTPRRARAARHDASPRRRAEPRRRDGHAPHRRCRPPTAALDVHLWQLRPCRGRGRRGRRLRHPHAGAQDAAKAL